MSMTDSEADRDLIAPATFYEVGRDKPPLRTRFVKGRSGNPNGRPKGARNRIPALNEERLKDIVMEEAYRGIMINDGDRQVTVPMAQAIIRGLAVAAVKGQPRALKMFTKMLAAVEQERKTQHDQLFDLAKEYRLKWVEELLRRESLGFAGPSPTAVVDCFVLGMKKGVWGRLRPEETAALEALEQRAHEEGMDLLDLLMEERDRLDGGSR